MYVRNRGLQSYCRFHYFTNPWHFIPKLLYNHTVYQYSLTSSSSGYLPLGVEYCEVGNRILHGVWSMQRLVESTAELKMVARTRQHGNNTSNRQQAAGSRSTQQAGGNGQELESNRQAVKSLDEREQMLDDCARQLAFILDDCRASCLAAWLPGCHMQICRICAALPHSAALASPWQREKPQKYIHMQGN